MLPRGIERTPPHRVEAAHVFQQFLKYNLTGEWRFKDCAIQRDRMRQIRTADQPLTLPLLKELRILDTPDVNGAFAFAPIVVPSNRDRIYISKQQAIRWAHHYDEPILTWFQPMRGVERDIDEGAKQRPCRRSKNIATIMPELKVYFVRGLPAVFTRNINVEIGIANGTSTNCRMHSITFFEQASHVPVIRRLHRGKLKAKVEHLVPCPHSINRLSSLCILDFNHGSRTSYARLHIPFPSA